MMGKTDEEMKGWREKFKCDAPRCEYKDPTSRDYRFTHTSVLPYVIVKDDLADIAASDVVVVNADAPSWGTAMEVVYARILHKVIVGFCGGEQSPWLKHHCTVLKSNLKDAIEWVNRFQDSILEDKDGL